MKKRILSLTTAVMLLLGCTTAALAESAIDLLLTAKTTQAFTEEAVDTGDLETILRAGAQAASAINQQPWHFVAISNPDILNELGGNGGFSAPSAGAAPAGEAPADGFGASGGAPAEGFEPSGGAPAEGFEPSGGAPAGGEGPSSGAPANMPAQPAAAGAAKAAVGDSPVAIIIYRNDATSSPDPDFDCGLACQNMVIAANALGYGAKIVSSPTRTLNGSAHDDWCRRLNVDASYQAVAVLLIGRADAEIDAASSASVRNSLDTVVSYIP